MNACLINGQAISSVSSLDRALQYGDGLFETIAVRRGTIPFWSDHYQRLVKGCEQLHLSIPSEAVLLQDVDRLKQNQVNAVIKIMITRGNGERGYRIPHLVNTRRIVQCFPWPHYSADYYKKGIRAIFCQTPISLNPHLAGLKHLNRLDNVLASSEWDDPHIAEGLMSDGNENVIQGTKSNVFAIKDGQLYTPELTQAGVAGIMRAQILQYAAAKGIPTHIQPIKRYTLLEADELFVTNSLFGIWPIVHLADKDFPLGIVTQQLLQHYHENLL